jgi:wyosine [tRNA(Phe)-imidazoG37] synthetase (radical SAM superfamily)
MKKAMTTQKKRRMVFGPVPSRRLGFSLGVDLVPFKTCPLDCIYCQLGRTTDRTVKRRQYIPSGEILRQVRAALKHGGKARRQRSRSRSGRVDWITLSGSGEPTLHSEVGEIIRGIKKMTDVPVAVLTSGTLLYNASVRKALYDADLVVPDLDAGSAKTFKKINRPHPSLDFAKMVSGIKEFVDHFPGRVWLELVLVKGINDTPKELIRIGTLAGWIGPERVQLNTVVRPPASTGAQPLSASEMRQARSALAKILNGIPIDIVSPARGTQTRLPGSEIEEKIISWLKRRPATIKDLAAGTGAPGSDIVKRIEHLVEAGKVREERFRGSTYYTAS